jgi:hypothetical protein
VFKIFCFLLFSILIFTACVLSIYHNPYGFIPMILAMVPFGILILKE